jgi:hypothetical protein
MICDWQNDYDNARQWEVLDATTGQVHPDMDIFYVDDELGIIRRRKRDENGHFYLVTNNGERVHREPKMIARNGREIMVFREYVENADGTRRYLRPADDAGSDELEEKDVAWEELPAKVKLVRKP